MNMHYQQCVEKRQLDLSSTSVYSVAELLLWCHELTVWPASSTANWGKKLKAAEISSSLWSLQCAAPYLSGVWTQQVASYYKIIVYCALIQSSLITWIKKVTTKENTTLEH